MRYLFTEKNGSDQTTVMAWMDEAELHKTVLNNHNVAALVALFSTEQIEKLTDKKIHRRVRNFIKKKYSRN
jgi:hypothetical protein